MLDDDICYLKDDTWSAIMNYDVLLDVPMPRYDIHTQIIAIFTLLLVIIMFN